MLLGCCVPRSLFEGIKNVSVEAAPGQEDGPVLVRSCCAGNVASGSHEDELMPVNVSASRPTLLVIGMIKPASHSDRVRLP